MLYVSLYLLGASPRTALMMSDALRGNSPQDLPDRQDRVFVSEVIWLASIMAADLIITVGLFGRASKSLPDQVLTRQGSIVHGLTRSKTGWNRTDKVSLSVFGTASTQGAADRPDHHQARAHDDRRPDPSPHHCLCLLDRVQ